MSYPTVIRNQISEFQPQHDTVSIDFEFRPGPGQDWKNPELTIAGVCSGGDPHSAFWDDRAERKIQELEQQQVKWAGHNSITTERGIIEKIIGHSIPLERLEDSMLRHYLCNAELTKGVIKSVEEDDETESKEKGMGFMDLWSMSSLYTELPQWKTCRGEGHCFGGCSTCDPLGYNGIDSLAPDIALPRLRTEMKAKGIPEELYENLKKLTVFCQAMTDKGIKVDRALVNKLEKEFEEKKQTLFASRLQPKIGKKGQELKTKELVWDSPFNPRSSQQVTQWFGEHGISLGSTEKDEIQRAIKALEGGEDPEATKWLANLYDYKDAGKGLKPWTSDRYFDKEDFLHPRFITTGTSLGRLSSSNCNCQNIPARGWGAGIRRAIVPRDESLQLVKADKAQLELRICLFCAGIEPPKDDAFTWLVENSQGLFHQIAADNPGKGMKPRDWTKSVSHGGNYLEGVKVFKSRDLDSPRNKKLIELGALVVYRDWEAFGGVVGFTGTNLAERLFGSASWENRAKALRIQEAYFGRFPQIRQWHRSITRQAENGYCRTPVGRYLTLQGSPEDKMKISAAMYGQGMGADDVQSAMRRYYDIGAIPILQCHDELVFEFPKTTPDSELLEFFSIFSSECDVIPGFSCPVAVSKGPNWFDLTKIGTV
jgi:hypothetical protein